VTSFVKDENVVPPNVVPPNVVPPNVVPPNFVPPNVVPPNVVPPNVVPPNILIQIEYRTNLKIDMTDYFVIIHSFRLETEKVLVKKSVLIFK
jgi:hypothetical protein